MQARRTQRLQNVIGVTGANILAETTGTLLELLQTFFKVLYCALHTGFSIYNNSQYGTMPWIPSHFSISHRPSQLL